MSTIHIPSHHYNALLANLGDEHRGLHGIRADFEHMRLVATDGYAMVTVPLELQQTKPDPRVDDATVVDGVPINRTFFTFKMRKALKGGTVVVDLKNVLLLFLNSKEQTVHREVYTVVNRGYPDWAKILPDRESMQSKLDTACFNPKLISRTTDALGAQGVKLMAAAPGKGLPMLVDVYKMPEVDLVVMPMRLT